MIMVRKYWIPGIFFGALLVYYIVGVAPDMTWMSQGGDAFDYVIGSKYMWTVRPTGYPTYILLGWLFERLPGNDFWNLGLISALSAWGTCIFIFLTVKHLVGQGIKEDLTSFPSLPYRIAPYIGAATYAGCFLVWTQAVIPEVYTLTTLIMVAATYFALKGRWYVCAGIVAVGIGTHHILVFTVVPLLVYLFIQKYRRLPDVSRVSIPACFGIAVLGFLPYLQTALCVHAEETTSGISSVFSQSSGSLGFVFALPLTETWGRITEAVPMLLTGLGIGLILPFFLIGMHKREPNIPRGPRWLLAVMVVLPFSYYFFSNIPMWVVYAIPGFAFASILVGYGASRFPYPGLLPIFLVVPVVFMGMNLGYYDIGTTVDSSPTGARELYTELDTIPDGAILYLHRWGEPWLETYYYSVENDNRFLFLFEGELRYHPEAYSAYKESQGIILPDNFDKYGELAENTLYYGDWDSELFLEDLVALNPDKEVWVVSATEGNNFEDMVFSFGRYTP